MHHVAHAVHIDDHARADDFFPCLSLPHAGPMQLRKSPIENTERKCDSLAMLYSHVIGVEMFNWEIENLWGVEMS